MIEWPKEFYIKIGEKFYVANQTEVNESLAYPRYEIFDKGGLRMTEIPKPKKCPECGADLIEIGDGDRITGTVTMRIVCEKCDYRG